jgi:hypothetical protein
MCKIAGILNFKDGDQLTMRENMHVLFGLINNALVALFIPE